MECSFARRVRDSDGARAQRWGHRSSHLVAVHGPRADPLLRAADIFLLRRIGCGPERRVKHKPSATFSGAEFAYRGRGLVASDA